MRLIVLVAGVFLSGLVCAQALPAPGEPMSSAKAVQLIRALEQAPLAKEAKAIRSDLIDWAEETKDVTILVCDVLGPIPGSKVPYGPELLVQSMFGNAAFQLEHTESRGDELKAQLAGIESMLRAYREILKSDPSAGIPAYDAWLKDSEAGVLAEHLTPSIREKCVDPNAKA